MGITPSWCGRVPVRGEGAGATTGDKGSRNEQEDDEPGGGRGGRIRTADLTVPNRAL